MKYTELDFNNKCILITGGAGFIGSNLIQHIINKTSHSVVNVDKLTYSENIHFFVPSYFLVQNQQFDQLLPTHLFIFF